MLDIYRTGPVVLIVIFQVATMCVADPYRIAGSRDTTDTPGLLADWILHEHYTLGHDAKNDLGRPVVELPEASDVSQGPAPLQFHGNRPTDRLGDLTGGRSIQTDAMTLELWLLDHVNRPVGTLLAIRDSHERDRPRVALGYLDGRITLRVWNSKGSIAGSIDHAVDSDDRFKKRWAHVVGVIDRGSLTLYVNGEPVVQRRIARSFELNGSEEAELNGYFSEENGMNLSNYVKAVRVWSKALSTQQIQQRFDKLADRVERGVLFPNDVLHFTAGPQLNSVGRSETRIVWETNVRTRAVVRYGVQTPLEETVEVQNTSRLHEIHLTELVPDQEYFYEIEAVDQRGGVLRSGRLTFSTAPDRFEPFAFGVISDTESRPHINNLVAKHLWSHRPNFLLHLGDMTDGGQRPHRFEWTHQYFQGMTQIASRVPVYPVPGNGESDLHWYHHYHSLPSERGYYRFDYGNASFYMLNSNESETDFQPDGEQYEWLADQLEQSAATWKIVAHHHPTYTADHDDYGNTWKGASTWGDQDVRPMVALYEKYDVDLVLFGHLHAYHRSLPLRNGQVDQSGVVHVQVGGSGGHLSTFAPNRTWFTRTTYPGFHAAFVQVIEDRLEFRTYDIAGRLRDTFVLEHENPHNSQAAASHGRPRPPRLRPQSTSFQCPMPVTAVSQGNRHSLRYTLDGSTPDKNSLIYDDSVLIENDAVLLVAAYDPKGRRSRTVKGVYRRVDATPLTSVQIKNPGPGLKYKYYEGFWRALPNYEEMSPIRAGVIESPTLKGIKAREDGWGVSFSGFLDVDRTGLYEFVVESDDGTKLYLHDRLVVDNDGSHSPRTRAGFVSLEAGVHPFRLDYFEDHAGETLRLQWRRPGGHDREPIPADVFVHDQVSENDG